MSLYYTLVAGIMFLLSLQLVSLLFPCYFILCNYTDSLPHGLYLLKSGEIMKGELIAMQTGHIEHWDD